VAENAGGAGIDGVPWYQLWIPKPTSGWWQPNVRDRINTVRLKNGDSSRSDKNNVLTVP